MNIKDATILITGAGGLLGGRLVKRFGDSNNVVGHFHNKPKDKNSIREVVGDLGEIEHTKILASDIKPDIIINCAALADVDRCEFEPELSRHVNIKAVRLLLKYFPDAKFVHVSTDYAFDTDHVGCPGDERNPVNTYGQHKVEGEKLVESSSDKNLIARVNTLFDFGTRRNYFSFILEKLRAGETIKGIEDQTSNPISTITAAQIIFELVSRNAKGIFHVGGGEFVSRYEFAVRVADYFGFDSSLVEPVGSDSFEHRAKRPRIAGLDCNKTEAFLGRKMPSLEEEFALYKNNI